MTLETTDLTKLAEIASAAARRAGEMVAASRPDEIEHKEIGGSEASQVVTDVDRRAQSMILEALAPSIAEFDLGVLSEEQPDSGDRFGKDQFWSIDPIDGTLAFIEGGSGYAVSIGLVSRDGLPLIGVVHDPVRDRLYRAVRGAGLTVNGQPHQAGSSDPRQLQVFFDRSFQDQKVYQSVTGRLIAMARDLGLGGLEIHVKAGAVMNACSVLDFAPACYFKLPKAEPGGGSLWDFAATACIFGEAGAIATDIHGAPLDLNRADGTFMNHRGVIFASDSDLAGRIRALADSVA